MGGGALGTPRIFIVAYEFHFVRISFVDKQIQEMVNLPGVEISW